MTNITPVFTLFVRDPATQEWEDVYTGNSTEDCRSKFLYDYNLYGEYTTADGKIVKTDGSQTALLEWHRKLNTEVAA